MNKALNTLVGIVCFLGLGLGSAYLQDKMDQEKEAHERRAGQIVQYDVNKDGLEDFVDGNGLIRLQQKDGTYFTVDEVKAQETRALRDSIKALDSKYKVRQEKVRNSVDNLDYKINRYVVGN